jgi:hypothetical protein
VSPKNLVLIAAAVLVMAMGVYLFIQVRATPAQAHVAETQPTTARPSPVPERSPEAPPTTPTPTPTPTPTKPEPTPGTARPITVGNATVQPEAMAGPTDEQRANPRLDSMMELANKAYDTQDFEQAIAIAGKVLSKDPTNVRMLRVMVSANCIAGDAAVAQSHYLKLPEGIDREQMKTRCERYQVSLKD